MTRSFYFLGAIIALTLVLLAQSVLLGSTGTSDAAAQASTAPADPAPDAVTVAIDDLAAWPAAASR